MNPPTYAELVEALKELSEEYAIVRFPNREPSFIGRTSPLSKSRALVARAESAKLVGTYVWVPVSERLPQKWQWYLVANDAGTGQQFYKGEGTWKGDNDKSITHWAEPLQHPSSLKGATE